MEVEKEMKKKGKDADTSNVLLDLAKSSNAIFMESLRTLVMFNSSTNNMGKFKLGYVVPATNINPFFIIEHLR